MDWEALEVLRNAGARIVRTDSDGATTVPWTAGLLLVRTYGASEVVVPTAQGGGGPRGYRGRQEGTSLSSKGELGRVLTRPGNSLPSIRMRWGIGEALSGVKRGER